MADFCKQCSLEIFGFDNQDLAGLNPEISLKEDEGFVVICEGCGATLVNHEGECINTECLKKHGEEK